MNEDHLEQLLNGISLLAAQNQIRNHLAYLKACGEEPDRAYAAPSYAYALAEQFREKITKWNEVPDDFDLDEFFDKTFGRPPGH